MSAKFGGDGRGLPGWSEEQELAFCESDKQLGRGVQVIVDRMARNDATMTEANLSGDSDCELSGLSVEFSSLSGECAAADGVAAVALLHMQESWMGRVRATVV